MADGVLSGKNGAVGRKGQGDRRITILKTNSLPAQPVQMGGFHLLISECTSSSSRPSLSNSALSFRISAASCSMRSGGNAPVDSTRNISCVGSPFTLIASEGSASTHSMQSVQSRELRISKAPRLRRSLRERFRWLHRWRFFTTARRCSHSRGPRQAMFSIRGNRFSMWGCPQPELMRSARLLWVSSLL